MITNKKQKYKNDKLGIKSFKNGASVTRFIQQGALTVRCPTQYLSWSQLFLNPSDMYWNCRLAYCFLFKKCGFDRYSMVNGCFKLPNIDFTIVPKKIKHRSGRILCHLIQYVYLSFFLFLLKWAADSNTQEVRQRVGLLSGKSKPLLQGPTTPIGHKNLI